MLRIWRLLGSVIVEAGEAAVVLTSEPEGGAYIDIHPESTLVDFSPWLGRMLSS